QGESWTTYTNANFVEDIVDVDDRLWCATGGGVARFDTTELDFTVFTNVDGLPVLEVRAVEVDEWGNIWVGTEGGGLAVGQGEGATWATYPSFQLEPENIRSLLGRADTLWVCTDEGLALITTRMTADWSDDEIDLFTESDGLANADVNVALVADSILWVGTVDGLNRVRLDGLGDPAQWQVIRMEDGLASDVVLSLAVQPGLVWAGTDEGISRWDGSQWVSQLAGLEVRQVAVGGDSVWATTDDGVWRYHVDGGWSDVTGELPLRDAVAVHVDSGGHVWIGLGSGRTSSRRLYGEGLARRGGDGWERYLSNGLASNAVADAVLDLDGTLWCTHFPGGVSHLTAEGWETFTRATTEGMLGSDFVLWCAVDSRGDKWFGTWGGGVSRLTADGQWLLYDQDNSPLQTELVGALTVDRHDNVWIFDYQNALYVRSGDDSTWTRLDLAGEDAIFDIAVDEQDIVWTGSYDRGIRRLDYAGTLNDPSDDAVTAYSVEHGLASPGVRAVANGAGATMWFGTTGGASQFDGTDFTTYRRATSGLLSDFVSDVVVDGWGCVWFLTDGGVSVLEPGGIWRSYTSQNSGLVSGTIGDWSNALLIDESQERAWIGTVWGLSCLSFIPPFPRPDGLASVRAYPNPFVPSLGHRIVHFASLPEDAEVCIFGLGGELVWESGRGAVSNGEISWSVVNSRGKEVAGGIYIYLVRVAGGEVRTGRVAVVR
ncbi:hypothetical protein AMJ39_02565, partial [candidate division TA06 bacterium DG_24]